MRRLKPWLLGVLVAVVYALHQDFWNWRRIEPVFWGFVPVGLGYHAVYSIVAVLLMWTLVKLAWPADLDRIESDRDKDQGEPRA
jgi:hypothetical protein